MLQDANTPGFGTRAVHAGLAPTPDTGDLVPPIHQTATFVFPSAEVGAARFAGEDPGYIYSRMGNPTVAAFEAKMADLEQGEAAIAFGSGMAALGTIFLALLNEGDHVLTGDALYSNTHVLLHQHFHRFGVETSAVDPANLEQLEAAIRPGTRLVVVESPANPTMALVDIKAAAEICHRKGTLLLVDNTFASPYLQLPLTLGADLVVHSATKYIGGHGDVIAGVAVGPRELLQRIRKGVHKNFGAVLAPFDAWLLIRGLKTLHIRMEAHCDRAQAVAEYLEGHPKVARVHFPGLPSHPQHELALAQMRRPGAMLSFELTGGVDSGRRVMNAVRLCTLAVSLGDAETLVEHPASMSHAVVPREERLKKGLLDGMVRLSVGLEDAADLIADLEQALAQA